MKKKLLMKVMSFRLKVYHSVFCQACKQILYFVFFSLKAVNDAFLEFEKPKFYLQVGQIHIL